MTLLLIVLAAGLAYLHFTGQLDARAKRLAFLALVSVLGLELVGRGQPLIGLGLIGATALWAFRPRLPFRRASMDEAEARALLGVGPAASPDEIRAAHRRLIAQVHPDRGGSAELARRVNAARDRLLNR